jgi:hypothetical protein
MRYVTSVDRVITKTTAPDMPVAVDDLLETPRKGHVPRNWASIMLLTNIAEIIMRKYSMA